MVIEGVGLHQVDNVESVQFSGSCVSNSEIVPLSIATCVVVRLQYKVVFIFVDLNRSSQVA